MHKSGNPSSAHLLSTMYRTTIWLPDCKSFVSCHDIYYGWGRMIQPIDFRCEVLAVGFGGEVDEPPYRQLSKRSRHSFQAIQLVFRLSLVSYET